MNWYLLAIVYLWVLGIPSFYKVIYRGRHSVYRLVAAHIWPISAPILFVIGLTLREPPTG